ncbi:hypothetical protein ABIA96_005476 [Bradyrhizobium sp. LB11.1]|jgi:hypothetical protein
MAKQIIPRLGLLVSAIFFSAGQQASAAMQLPTPAASMQVEYATPVTFWAHSYPYRYVPRRRCPQARVETPYGWYWDRVCVTATGPILRRAY